MEFGAYHKPVHTKYVLNPKFMKNTKRANWSLGIYFNSEVSSTNIVGGISGFEEAWVQTKEITNILSLKIFKYKFWVTYDIIAENKFEVHKQNRKKYLFVE